MIGLAGYEVGAQLPSGDRTLVFRGRRTRDGLAVVLKLASSTDPYQRQRSDLGHEYELLRSLAIPGIPRAIELVSYHGRPVLVIEDTGTPTLRETCRKGALALAPFLEFAVRLVEILAQLHEAGIIHKDINPSNVMLDPYTGRVDLIDFGISSRLPRETTSYHAPNLLEGTLAYLSPEQTGRMNRAVDYRSDFYALGMTFYELLTGRVAFPSDDLLELCHCHIARIPTPPSAVNPDIPDAISRIVMKLVSKMAEQRYQSAYGLLVDLRDCQRRLSSGAGFDGFVPGVRDVSRVLSIPQKLYGRDPELEQLLGAFERVCTGAVELVTVSGYSGIGKSSLIHEIYRPIVKSGGYFISGKFDQYRRDVPYEAFVQAIRQLCRDLLLEGDDQFSHWKQRFDDALGSNAAVLAQLIGEIERFTGALPAPPELGAADAQRRLITAFQQLVGMFVALGRPLVVFLDDLQWADPASLMLLQALATSSDSRQLMLIGAYRDNEVDASHPLQLTWNAIDSAQVVTRRCLSVLPLRLDHIEQLLGDTFGASRSSTKRLASLLASKTSGNPFFLGQMLVSMHHHGLVEFDPFAGEWRWDIDRIASAQITDNVVDLMLGELRRVSPATQRLLQRAACIGSRFELAVLATVDGHSIEDTAHTLWPALVAGFIAPEDDSYRQSAAIAPGARLRFRFSHDRVQQAAHAMIPEHERAAIHLQIGRMLLGDSPQPELGSEVFEVFSHFSVATGLIESPGERTRVAHLALAAGRRARASHAYATAAHVLESGTGLLPDDPWQADYELTLALAMELAHAEYQSGEFERAERRFRGIIGHAQALHERAEAYRILLTLHENAGRFADAVGCGIECMRLFDIDISPSISHDDAIAIMRDVVAALGERRIPDLIDSPPLTDLAQLALSRVGLRLSSIAYFISPAMYTAVSSQTAMVYLKYGNTPAAAAVYTYFGATLCGWGEFDDGFAFADLGLALRDKYQDDQPGHVIYMQGAWLISRRDHLRVSIEWLRRGYRECVAAGDLHTAGYCVGMTIADMFVRGTNLSELHREALRGIEFCDKIKSSLLVDAVTGIDRACRALLGMTDDPSTYNDGEGFDEIEFDAHVNANRPHNVRVWWYLHRAFVCYVFGDYDAAQAASDKVEPLLWAIFAQIRVPEYRFHRALIGLARWPDLTGVEQAQVIEQATATLAELQRSAAMTPTTFGPRADLLAAEIARVRGDRDAADLYDAAIGSALEHDHIQIAAISCERALRHALDRNQPSRARGYLLDALQHYSTWGAARKLVQLGERHRVLLPNAIGPVMAITRTVSRSVGSYNARSPDPAGSMMVAGGGLDLHTATKASQAISSEIRLDRLLEKLTQILIESAGAERGAIVLKSDDRLLVEAAFTATGEVRVLESIELASYRGLPVGVIAYVARTGEQIVLDSAASSAFASDPHFVAHAVKSVLCLPITNQSRLVGVVYLENNLVESCFTIDRIEVLRILMTQIAISIDNARLYAGMEAKVRDRTAALSARERSLRLILDSTGDGLLSVDLDGQVRGQISAAIASWFGRLEDGAVIWDALAPHDAGFRWALEFGISQLRDDVLPFDLAVVQMPTQLVRGLQVFELDYKPVFEAERFARVLIRVRDVTAKLTAERAEREARERQSIVAWLVKDREGLRGFVKDAEQLLDQLSGTGDPVIAARLIHTLKGNAALYGFASLAERCHALETELEDAVVAQPSAEQIAGLAQVFGASLRGLEDLLQMQRKTIELAEAEYAELVEAIESRSGHAELLDLVQSWRWPKAADLLARVAGQIGAAARSLDKSVRIDVVDHELRIAPHRFDGFLAALVHVARNAVDHGIEPAAQRVQAGKPSEGVISLALGIERDELVLEIRDDGRGIDSEALAAVAARRGVVLREPGDVVELLFTDGVSTRDAVSEFSGRGVGLAAVRAACEQLGGRVEVAWAAGRGTTFRFAFSAAWARGPDSATDRLRHATPLRAIASGGSAPSSSADL
jgi:predicted ATPase/GAF domain-containing protein/HPt (histidine-containing phosphotransfer) domain-containing protein